jgi:tetratricopeptide (TPR) repeat protein
MDSYLGGLSRFSLSYNFGMTLEEQKVSREKELKEQVKELVEKEFRQKENAKAASYYDKAFDLYKQDKMEDALDEVENALTWSKDYSDAKKLKALIGRKLVGSYYDRAISSYKKGDLISALEDFKNVNSIDNGYKDAREYISRINEKLEMKSGARELFAKGVELYANKQYDEASDVFNKALAIEPDNKVIKTYVSKTSARMRKSGGGRTMTDEQAQQVKKLYFAGLKMYTAGDLRSALRAWKEAIAINPDDIKLQKSIEKAQAEQAELQKRGIK